MTRDALYAAEKRAARAPWWRWRAGARVWYEVDGTLDVGRVVGFDEDAGQLVVAGESVEPEGVEVTVVRLEHGPRPDFNDPATCGCLEHLARKRYGSRLRVLYSEPAAPMFNAEPWIVTINARVVARGPLRAVALVRALDAAGPELLR